MVRSLLAAALGAYIVALLVPATGWTADEKPSKADREKEKFIKTYVDKPLKISSRDKPDPDAPKRLYLILRKSEEWIKLAANQSPKNPAMVKTARDGSRYEYRQKLYLDTKGSAEEAREFVLPWMTEHVKFGLSRKEAQEYAATLPPKHTFKVVAMGNNDARGRQKIDKTRAATQKYIDEQVKKFNDAGKKAAKGSTAKGGAAWTKPRR